MPSLLKAADLASAHIIRGRLDAEGHQVGVVHENAANLWGGAVAGGPVLVAPPAAFPEVEKCVRTVEEMEPPAEAFECRLRLPPTSPGIDGSMMIGTLLVGVALAIDIVIGNVIAILGALTIAGQYHDGPIPLYYPDPRLALGALVLGALAGAGIHLLKTALRNPVSRIIIAAFISLLFSNLPALVIAAVIACLHWAISFSFSGNHRG